MGCTAVFARDYLLQLNGVQALAETGFALYSEYLLLVQCGLLEKVVYLNERLVLYRIHDASWGCSNVERELYVAAGKNLIARSLEVLQHPKLRRHLRASVSALSYLSLNELQSKSRGLVLPARMRQVGSLVKELIVQIAALPRGAQRLQALLGLTSACGRIAILMARSLSPHRGSPS
jgi:hypothetical protein